MASTSSLWEHRAPLSKVKNSALDRHVIHPVAIYDASTIKYSLDYALGFVIQCPDFLDAKPSESKQIAPLALRLLHAATHSHHN